MTTIVAVKCGTMNGFFSKCDRYKKTFKYFANYSRLKQDERSIQRLRIFQTIV